MVLSLELNAFSVANVVPGLAIVLARFLAAPSVYALRQEGAYWVALRFELKAPLTREQWQAVFAAE